MEIADILMWIIIIIICLTIAPLMTIGIIFILADSLGLFGDIIGVIFFILGVGHMYYKITEL